MKNNKAISVGESIVGAVNEVRSKASTLDELVRQKANSSALMEEVAARIEEALAPIVRECDSGKLQPEVAAQKLLEVSRGILAFVKTTSRNMLTEAQQTKGYAEGFSTALRLIEDLGAAAKREESRVMELAMSDVDLDGLRKTGERPEALRVKRKAAALRNKSSEIFSEKSEDAE